MAREVQDCPGECRPAVKNGVRKIFMKEEKKGAGRPLDEQITI
jgi:hypothetical protein